MTKVKPCHLFSWFLTVLLQLLLRTQPSFAKIQMFPLSEYFYFKEAKAKGGGTELQTGIWMCERSSNLVTSTQRALSDGNSARGKHLPLVWVGACLCRQLSLSVHGTIPLFSVFRQKFDHATYLTVNVLVPALLLGQIFQGTANLLSSAPADRLCQHCHLQNPTQGEESPQGLSPTELLWPGAITQGLLQPFSRSQVPFEKLLFPIEIKVPPRVFCNK